MQCTMNIFGSQSRHLNTSENCKVFSFPLNFSNIWWFFWVLLHIWPSPLWKIIKYCKKFWENEKKIFQIFYFLNGHFWNQKCSQWLPQIALFSEFTAYYSMKSLVRYFFQKSQSMYKHPFQGKLVWFLVLNTMSMNQ